MSSSAVYEGCLYHTEGRTDVSLLQCVSDGLDEAHNTKSSSYLSWLLVICGALVFFMQAGFAMLCAGCVRKKNVQNTMLKNLLDACGAAIAFYAIGFGFAFGGQNNNSDVTFIGTENFFSTGSFDQGFWFFEYAFSATAVTIVAGTLAERCQMVAYMAYSLFLTGFVYPVVAHSLWSNNGFLSAFAKEPFQGIGTIDFAGSGVVHVTGGTTALIATFILGARRGRFHDSRGRLLATPKTIQGHSMALQLLGTMLLWFGWFGFNSGSALLLGVENTGKVAGLAAVNTSLAAAAGCCTSLFANLCVQERKSGEVKFDLGKAMNGALGALVAITAPCGTVENWAAVVIGAIAGLIYLVGSWTLIRFRLDDAVDAIPVHMWNGVWGMIATGLFTSPKRLMDAYDTDEHVGLFYEFGRSSANPTLLLNQLLATGFVIGWVSVTMIPFFLWLNYMGWFRADSLEELVGLDLLYFGNRRNVLDLDDISEVIHVDRKDMNETESLHEEIRDEDEVARGSSVKSAPSAKTG